VRIVSPDGILLAERILDGPAAPDLGAVDQIARIALVARRIGGTVAIDIVSPELRALLELCGLATRLTTTDEMASKREARITGHTPAADE
jgi:hypothetical protein